MFVDKTLLLKGVAGVAAVGGVVGGSFAAQKAGLFSPSSNAGAAQSGAANPATIEEDYGIPKRCNDSPDTPCELTQDELKKIKFEVLGEGDTPAVTVENFPEEGKKISLTIDSTDSTRKKYIFSNTSTQDVIVKRDESKKVTLKVGKTKFTAVGGKLKEKELGEYGEPKDCTTSCTLTSSDLEDIKFKDLDGGTEAITVTPKTGTVSLEIKDVGGTKRFIFTTSSQEVVIKKSEDKKITFTSNKKTQFTGSESKLNKFTYDSYGVPTTCTSSCTLTADDLGEIKFEELDGTGTVSSGAGNVTLKVDSSDAADKRFTFENSGSPITITKPSETSKVVTLSKGKTRFKGASDKLKKIVVDNKGLPSDCTQTCKLTAEDLGEIKFEELDGGTGTVSPTNQTVTLTVESSPSKKYKFNNSSGSAITITKGEGQSAKTVTLTANKETEFTENSAANALKLETPEANGVPAKCKAATASNPCQLTAEDLKNIKFKSLDGGAVTLDPVSLSTNQITLSIDSSNSTKIYTFKNSGSKVTLKKGSGGDSNSVVLEKGETEFKEESEKLVIYEENSLKAINEKIGNLKLPYSCKFRGTEKDKTTKECDVTKEDLKKVNFENKESSDLTVSGPEGNIRIEIKRLKKDDEVDTEKYGSNINNDDLRVTFKNTDSKITVTASGSNTITIPKNSNTEFSVNTDNKLSKSYKSLSGLPNSWAVLCTKESTGNKYKCNPVGNGTNIKIFTDFSTGTYQELQIDDGSKEKKIFTAEEDVDDYNLGVKFTVNEAITASGSSPSLTANDNYEIKYSTAKKK